MARDERFRDPDEAGADEELPPADAALWSRLSPRLGRPGGPLLGAETVRALEQACPAVELAPELFGSLDRMFRTMQRDQAFDRSLGTRPATLGGYLAWLRGEAGLPLREAARRFGFDFQLLTDLEADRLGPERIPARPLAALIQRLEASLPRVEELILGTVRAPRYVSARGSLFRGAKGATRGASEAASLAARGESAQARENPDYAREAAAARALVDELRRASRG